MFCLFVCFCFICLLLLLFFNVCVLFCFTLFCFVCVCVVLFYLYTRCKNKTFKAELCCVLLLTLTIHYNIMLCFFFLFHFVCLLCFNLCFVCVCVCVKICVFVPDVSDCRERKAVPLHGNFELRPLGATMGNASSVTRAWRNIWKKHHPLAGDSPWRHYRRDHNIRTAGRIHHQLFRLHWLICLKKPAFW